MKRFYLTAEKLMNILPDWVTGKSEIMKQKYYRKYGSDDCSSMIRQNKIRTASVYMILFAVFTIIIIHSLLGQLTEKEKITGILRPLSGEPAQTMPLEARLSYKDNEIVKDITINVKQKEMTASEKLKYLKEYKKTLESIILGENEDRNHINKPLNLPERDQNSGITLQWTSSRPDLINEKGEVDLIEAKNHELVNLTAEITYENTSASMLFPLRIDTNATQADIQRSMADRLIVSLKEVTDSNDSARLTLPQKLGDGVEVIWFKNSGNNGIILLPFLIFLALIVYFKRYDRINNEIKAAEESVLIDLPEFINKLVLLLNAGLVVSTAFEKIIMDYDSFKKTGSGSKGRNRYLYEQLSEIQKRVFKSNTSLIGELKKFSQRCGVREMVRLTAVISDNWDKGSALAEKLESEGELLWICRKKKAEEKGKLAETKLTFPLVILLLVLIMIVIAPAMMEM